ncbi:MAG: oligosaccharide flippase family protein [Clostridia bacterium]|nr:oligosaccharide flippase family protein [Clostridia bacterium]
MSKSKVAKNTIMLYLMSIAKLILPLLTLPYLTRVLSEETYGMVSYVKSCMTYMQLIVDFGFILSSVKDIVNANEDKTKIGYITGNTFLSKLLLCIFAGVVLVVMCFTIPILQLDIIFVILSFISVVTTVFLADFLFRGIEKMQYITIIFVVTKIISTTLTFLFVKGDQTVLWIPILDIIAHLVAVSITFFIIHKLNIPVRVSGIKSCLSMIKDSFFYFLSSVATTAFSALNTLLIGIYITDLAQVAHWSLCLNIITAIQGLYAPICNSVYPHMIKEKSLNFIHKVLKIFMPIVTIGCIFSFFVAKYALLIVGGEKYVDATTLFRWMIPILFFSFPAQLYGWPTLGAIGKVKETTASTIIAAVTQIIGLVLLILFNQFNLISLAILRFSTEAILMIVRMTVTYKNKKLFIKEVGNA